MTGKQAMRVERMWNDGIPCEVIAKELGIPKKGVYDYVRTHGGRFRRRRSYSRLLIDAVVKKMEDGMSVYEAEETYGIHGCLLEKWLVASDMGR